MKKCFVLAIAVMLPYLGISQSLFDKYEDSEDVGSVIINKGMIDLVSEIAKGQDDEEAQAFVELTKGLKNIKIFISESDVVTSDMGLTVNQYVKKSKLSELMKIKDGDTNVKFFVRNGKDDSHVKELLMFATGIEDAKMGHKGKNVETVILTMTGDIDLTQVGKLTDKMNLPGSLKKVSEKGE